MSVPGLWRVLVDGRVRLAKGPADQGPAVLLALDGDVDDLLSGPVGALSEAINADSDGPVPASAQVLVPIENQEVWAAGVTYERSRTARNEEAGSPDYYDKVYDADRPELFFKASAGASRGPGEPIEI
jgi:2-dehydro-3-deoxy-D-arabinonate dehydratase